MKAPFLHPGLADVLWLSLAGLCLPAIQAASSFRVQIAWTESGQARLSWSAPGPGYEYTVETTRSLAPPDWQILAPAEQWPTPETHCLIEPNADEGARFYRVKATGIFDPDNPPQDLAAVLREDGVVLDWSPVAGASGYALYWATSAVGWPESALRVGEVHPPYLLPDLPPGQTIHLAVAALAGSEEGVRGLPIVVHSPGQPIDPTVATTLFSASRFLYQGGLATQEGVAENAIEPARTAVISGRLLTADGAPLIGVSVVILDHDELGTSRSRLDGSFDMVVNGGGLLILECRKDGYLPVQRKVRLPWQAQHRFPDIVLLARDSNVTTVTLGSGSSQVALGSPQSDADGNRRASLLIPAGTEAQVLQSDGTPLAVDQLHVRLTEYTVGPQGLLAMPGDLPPTTGYTYALEVGADESIAKVRGRDVLLSKPVILYEENFLGFPVGGVVPLGYYDNEVGNWIPSRNGRVIALVGVVAGRAQLDTNGDGEPDDGADLGITDDEREQLARLHPVGRSLWRMPLPHFSTWDANWGKGPPLDAEPPKIDSTPYQAGIHRHQPEPCELPGSIIEAQNQVLGETIPLAGTDYQLHYRSLRAPGRVAAYEVPLPLSRDVLPPGLKQIDLAIQIAGQSHSTSFEPAANLTHTFTWDGRDGFGRRLKGSRQARIHVDYVYDGEYQTPADLERSFGYQGNGIPIGVRARGQFALGQDLTCWLGTWDARAQGLGGWTLNVHHAYDPVAGILYRGDGSVRHAINLNQVIETVAGGSDRFRDDVAATETTLGPAGAGLAVGPDGTVFVADTYNNRIRRIDPEGTIRTLAGGGTADSGDGLPGEQARLNGPHGLALGTDLQLYFSEAGAHRIRRLDRNGVLWTVAGQGMAGFSGDGGPAAAAQLNRPLGIAMGTDGALIIADSGNHRIRQVGPDGTIRTLAGKGLGGFAGDGGPATEATLQFPSSIAVGPDGSVYLSSWHNNRVRRISPTGTIDTVAGGGSFPVENGVLAVDAAFAPDSVAVGLAGEMLITSRTPPAFFRVDPAGRIWRIAGNGQFGFTGDGGPALQARLEWPVGSAVDPLGNYHLVVHERVRRIRKPLPAFGSGELAIASENGRGLYRFDAEGRHLSTLDALTGTTLLTFRYDAAGWLVEVDDGQDNHLRIERDLDGSPLALVAPFGQRTELAVDEQGHLERVTNPAGQSFRFTTDSGGLLTELRNRRDQAKRFAYDTHGRLIRHEDVGGNATEFSREDAQDGFAVEASSPEGRIHRFEVTALSDGTVRRDNTFPDQTHKVLLTRPDTGTEVTWADGVKGQEQTGADPRFGMQSPTLAVYSITTPTGLSESFGERREAELANAANPLSLLTASQTTTWNGAAFVNRYTASNALWQLTSPAGRRTRWTIDERGRLVAWSYPGRTNGTQTFDPRGRLVSVTQGNRRVTLAYDPDSGLATAITNALQERIGYLRDNLGRITRMDLPDTTQWGFEWDAENNLTALVEPNPALRHVFAYSPQNRLQRYRSPLGLEEVFEYNRDGEWVARQWPSGRRQEWNLNSRAQLESISTPEGDDRFSYSETTGRLVQETSRDGVVVDYQYDGHLLIRAGWSGLIGSVIAYQYNAGFQPSRLDYAGITLPLGYDQDGRLTNVAGIRLIRHSESGIMNRLQEGDFEVTFDYNPFGEISQVSVQAPAAVGSVLYTRDILGRITRKTETLGGTTTDWEYRYDTLGQLIQVLRNDTVIESYAYDAAGNRIGTRNAFVHLGEEDYDYDADHRLLRAGSTHYTYDADGRLATLEAGNGIQRFSYHTDGTLGSVELPGRAITYRHDARGRRVVRLVNGVPNRFWVYGEGRLPLAEYDGASALRSIFVHAGPAGPVKVIRKGVPYHLVLDHLGSPRLVLTTEGQTVRRIDYDAFGNIVQDTNPDFDLPFGFAAGISDPDHELLRFGTRDYQPSTGRWTASDPRLLEGGRRLRVYAGNDPVNRLDPTGTLERSTCNEPRAIPLTSRDLINRGADEDALARAGMMSEPRLENLEQQLRLAKKQRMQGSLKNIPRPPGFSAAPDDHAMITAIR